MERSCAWRRRGIPDDPGRLDEIRGRRRALRELQRKYGDTLGEVVAFGESTRRRVAVLEGYEMRAGSSKPIGAADTAAHAAAAALSAARRAAAGPLGEAVTGHLRELAMPHAVPTVDVSPAGLTDDGADAVTFLLAPQPGGSRRSRSPEPAPGGELSRAMLALRLVLTEGPPTLVFDEVDAGIGGEAGAAVGRLLLADLASSPSGALCDLIWPRWPRTPRPRSWSTSGRLAGRTVTAAGVVDGDARVAELSRMLAGLVDSAHAQRHAAELIRTGRGARNLTRLSRPGGAGARVFRGDHQDCRDVVIGFGPVAKHIFVTGGVASSLGKGLTASSLGRLLKSREACASRSRSSTRTHQRRPRDDEPVPAR